jgi:4-hydroxy-2-oxoglutarate aldolase
VTEETNNLSGLFPAFPTPFTVEGKVDFFHLKSNIEKANHLPLNGYVIGGSNGEFAYLNNEERVQVVSTVKSLLPEGHILIAGAGLESTQATIELATKIGEVGADFLLILTPHYFTGRMTAEALENHYRLVAEASPVPVLLYSVPANTGINLPIEAVVRLASHPNIVGMKDSGGDVARIGYIIKNTPEDFSMLAGSVGFFLGALAVGAVGSIGALLNIASHDTSKILDCFRKGDLERAKEIQLRLIEPNYAVTSRFGVPGLKAAMEMQGFYGGPVRSPLLPISEVEKEELKEILVRADLL